MFKLVIKNFFAKSLGKCICLSRPVHENQGMNTNRLLLTNPKLKKSNLQLRKRKVFSKGSPVIVTYCFFHYSFHPDTYLISCIESSFMSTIWATLPITGLKCLCCLYKHSANLDRAGKLSLSRHQRKIEHLVFISSE